MYSSPMHDWAMQITKDCNLTGRKPNDTETRILFDEAMSMMNYADQLLTDSEKRCTELITRLKSTPREDLSPEDQKLLDSQLAHEEKAKALGWI